MWRSAASSLPAIILRRVASSAAASPLFLPPALFLRPISSASWYLPPPATVSRSTSFQLFAGGPRTFATRGRRAASETEEDEDKHDFDGDSDDFEAITEEDSEFDDSDDDEDNDGVDHDDNSDG